MVASSALTALYPGSFDPFHNGHLDVVEQSVELFGAVVIAVMHNPQKPSGLIDLGRRVELVQACVSHLPTVRVAAHPGLAVDAARSEQVNFIVKGLRTPGDFEIEQQMAHTNYSVSGVRTVYLPCRPGQSFISSRFIRDIAQHRGQIGHLVPVPVATALAGIFGEPVGDHRPSSERNS